MRNLEIKILIAITAFSFVIAAGIFFQEVYPRLFWQPVSLCITKEFRPFNQMLNEKDTVTLRGYLRNGKYSFFANTELSACKNDEVEIQLDELTNEKIRSTYDLLREFNFLRSGEEFPQIRIEVAGKLKKRQTYLSTSHYFMEANTIMPVDSLENMKTK